MQVYLDNIFIYNKILKDHHLHTRQVLEYLHKAEIQADINKCKFHIQKTKFLGRIISTKSIQINLQKVSTILD